MYASCHAAAPWYIGPIPWGSPQPIQCYALQFPRVAQLVLYQFPGVAHNLYCTLAFFGVAHNQNPCTRSASSSQEWQCDFAFWPHTHKGQLAKRLIHTYLCLVFTYRWGLWLRLCFKCRCAIQANAVTCTPTILQWTFRQHFLRQDVIENSCSPERNALHSCSTKFLRLALKPYSSTDSKPVICPLKAHTSTLI